MICVHLDLYLLSYLVLHSCLFYFLLVDHLYTEDKSSSQVTSHVDVSESTFS